jgi:hypothetical protein
MSMLDKLKKAEELIPDSERNLLACNECRLIRTSRQFN